VESGLGAYLAKLEGDTVNVMKLLGIALLCIASLVVLLRVGVPAACLVLGLGIDIPNTWARSAKVLFFYWHPWVYLLVGMLLLALCGRGALRLVRG